jgi:hypothetical protein
MNATSGQFDQPQIQPGHSTNYTAKKIFRMLAAAAIALAGILVITLASRPGNKDYISYWSSGKLLVHYADPYSPVGVFVLEKAHGFPASKPLMMRNPPWTLFLVAPLGFTSARIGLLLWTIAAAACILASVSLLNVFPRDRALAFIFAPALASICCGQSSPFLLLGFSLFLRFHRSRPFLAGASLLLMAIKPHLFLIFWVVLLVDCIYRRRLLILAGLASALAASTALAMCLNPHIWANYFSMLRSSALEIEVFPTASMFLRLFIDPRAEWLLFVPSTLAIVWGLWYYARTRQVWDWKIHGMLLMLVTVFVSPYGWFTDEIVLLPSTVFALTFPEKPKSADRILIVINTAALVIVLGVQATFSSPAYLWTPVTWLLWFLYATRGFRHVQTQSIAHISRPAEFGPARA